MTNTTTETELDRIFAAGKAVEGDHNSVESECRICGHPWHTEVCGVPILSKDRIARLGVTCTCPAGLPSINEIATAAPDEEQTPREANVTVTLKGDLVSGRIVRQNLLADFECRACAWWAKRPGGFTFTRSDVTAYSGKCNGGLEGAEALEHLYAHLHVRCPRCGALVTMPPADKWPVAQASTICVRCDHEPHVGRCGICPDCTEFPCSSHHTRACQCVGEFPVETTPSGVRVG